MLNYITPIVLICSIVKGEPNVCDGNTALDRQELDAVNTPTQCLVAGTAAATNYIVDYEKEHPNKKLQYRIICKTSDKV